jgi:hypothetical protein
MVASLANLFFERASGCLLDVHISAPGIRRTRLPSDHTIPTLSPGKRIRTLCITCPWIRIQEFVGGWTDALSPLQVLDLNADGPSVPSQSTIFFGDALKDLKLFGFAVPGLNYIRAPNLTKFRLCEEFQTPCSATGLLDFLEASPALEEVSIDVNSTMVDDFSPPNRTAALPHVRFILLSINHAPQLASHLVCPSSTDTHLVDMLPDSPTDDIFPQSLHQLSGQYSVEMIDRVMMRVSDRGGHEDCTLQLRSPSDTRFRITCETAHFPDAFPEVLEVELPFSVLFDQTVSALLSLPLGNVTTLSIDMGHSPSDPTTDPTEIIRRFAEIFEKCRKLYEVVLENYLPRYLSALSRDRTPPIQALVIKHPEDVSWEELAEHVIEVARIRHSRAVPLKRIEIIATSEGNPRIEQLESWVQEVKYRVEPSQKNRRDPWL